METSPLENLLIEHPSMSVYVHHARRHEAEVEPVAEVEEEADDDEVVVMLAEAGGDDVVVVRRAAHLNRVHVLRQQQEQLRLRSNNAQKVHKNILLNCQKRFHVGISQTVIFMIMRLVTLSVNILTSES
jgi:hypothetical protein